METVLKAIADWIKGILTAGISGLSHPYLRGDLRCADTIGSNLRGCHQLHLEHCGLHRSALFQPVQDQLRDEIRPRSALKEVFDWLRIFPFPVI